MDNNTEKTLDKETSNRITFITFMIPYFANTYHMTIPDAFDYLEKYGGLDFMFEHWWALHTDNAAWTAHDIYEYCHKNGAPR